ncbi:YesL family protein [Terrisporobacter vanillatitrophus]|uniref:YesL family protein n=1 Tax=Terrisporobacter vanillatitrophus TaxID=3058402 RepID=UPI003EBD9734
MSTAKGMIVFMYNLFSYDNKFFEILEKITDIVILNLLCIISCLPIVTIGASITAVYSVAMKMIKDEETYIVKEFIRSFKENFKTSTIVWSIMLIIGGVLLFDFYMSRLVSHESVSKVLQCIFTIIGIMYTFTLTYVFPIISKFENTIKNTMINSALISIQNLPYTVIMVILNLSPFLLINLFSSYWGQIIFLYTVIGFGIIIYTNSIIFEQIFNKLIK